MNNTRLYLDVGIPSVFIILAWIANKTDAAALRGHKSAPRAEMRSRMAGLAESLRSEMNALRRAIDATMASLHERLAVVQAIQK